MLDRNNFIKEIDQKKTDLYVITNKNGLMSEISNYGARVVSLWVPDKNGDFDDIVLGCESIDDYINVPERYLGAIIGRYGNRIKSGEFMINNTKYSLSKNDGKNHLHGGLKGFHDVVWDVISVDINKIELEYTSPNLEEGYPGRLITKVTYTLTDKNELKIEYFSKTNSATYVNLTHHSYFNLKGAGKGTIEDHLLYINSKQFTPVDSELIPIGNFSNVLSTPFDFTNEKEIGKDINDKNDQIKYGKGYDHNFVLDNNLSEKNISARVIEKISGRTMEVYTNEPGIQFYSGNFLDGSTVGKDGNPYKFRSAFCLETQHFPDSPNNNNFPSTRLEPDENYYSVCIYKFSVTN